MYKTLKLSVLITLTTIFIVACERDFDMPPIVEITVNITDVACYGDATGEIDISLISGSPSFVFQWSNGDIVEPVLYSATLGLTSIKSFTDCP